MKTNVNGDLNLVKLKSWSPWTSFRWRKIIGIFLRPAISVQKRIIESRGLAFLKVFCLHLAPSHSLRVYMDFINDKFPQSFLFNVISRRLYPKKKIFSVADDCCSKQFQLFSGILYIFWRVTLARVFVISLFSHLRGPLRMLMRYVCVWVHLYECVCASLNAKASFDLTFIFLYCYLCVEVINSATLNSNREKTRDRTSLKFLRNY